MAYKFYNPTDFLVSFNVSRKMASGAVVSKWVSVEKKSYFDTEDAEIAKQARMHTEVNMAMEGLKGHLVEVAENVKVPVEAAKVSEKPKKSK